MQAIVIFANCNDIDLTCKNIAEAMSATTNGPVKMHVLDTKAISGIVVAGVMKAFEKEKPSFVSTEEGDASVIALAGMCNMGNYPQFVAQLAYILNNEDARWHNEAIRAVSLIAQGAKISAEVKKKYHFTDTIKKTIVEFHKHYNNG